MSVNDVVPYRRKREGRTNYKKRLVYLKSGVHRLVVRKTNKQMILQIVEYTPDGDKIVCGTTSGMLKKHGWKFSLNSIPACYLTGILIAKSAKEKKVTSAIADFGLQSNVAGSRIYAAVKGAIDGGLKVPADEKALPSKERISGEHIAKYYGSSSPSQFSKYKKEKSDAAAISKEIDALKKKLIH